MSMLYLQFRLAIHHLLRACEAGGAQLDAEAVVRRVLPLVRAEGRCQDGWSQWAKSRDMEK